MARAYDEERDRVEIPVPWATFRDDVKSKLDAMTVTGRSLGEELEAAGPGFKQDVVRPRSNPIFPQGGIAVLQGNLSPGGCIIKQSAADPFLIWR